MSFFNRKKETDNKLEPKSQTPVKSALDFYNEGIAFHKQKDFVNAANKFRVAAEAGHPTAQMNLGVYLMNGLGVEKDPEQAVKWFSKAAGQGNPSAMYNLAMSYTQGLGGLKKSYTEAAEWLYKASDKGNAKALEMLGKFRASGLAAPDLNEEEIRQLVERVKNHDLEALYLAALCSRDGMGTKKNEYEYYRNLIVCEHNKYEPAYRLFRELDTKKLIEYGSTINGDRMQLVFFNAAIKLGDPEAWMYLGNCYRGDLGLPEDLSKAMQCYESGYEAGNKLCAGLLGELYLTNDSIKDIDKGIEWFKKAALEGSDVRAMHNLGIIYSSKSFGLMDFSQAEYWYKKAAETGSPKEVFSLGMFYHAHSEGTPYCNKSKGVSLLEKAAEAGYVQAMIYLGSIYHTGDGVEVNRSKSLELIEKAAAKGDFSAMGLAGTLIMDTKNASLSDKQKALEYLRRGAEGGDAVSMYHYAEEFKKGEIVPKSDSDYIYWLSKSAEKNYRKAVFDLAAAYWDGSYGTEQDRPRAEALFKSILPEIQKGVEGDDKTGEYHFLLALMYENGYIFEKDLGKYCDYSSYAGRKLYKPALEDRIKKLDEFINNLRQVTDDSAKGRG